MAGLGFNISKGAIWFCALDGTIGSPAYIDHGKRSFNPDQPRPDLMNFFKQSFSEMLDQFPSRNLAYRLSLDGKKADQIAYLYFSFGILNLVAHERGIHIKEFTSQSFSKKALGYVGDKFEACDNILGRPAKWDREAKLAALSAWMVVDA